MSISPRHLIPVHHKKKSMAKEAAEASSSTSARLSTVPDAGLPQPRCWKDAANRALVSNGKQQSPSTAHYKKRKKSWHGEDEKNSQPSHFEMNLLVKERIRHFTWTWFCMTMATGGIANVLYASHLLSSSCSQSPGYQDHKAEY
jgi:hypothetical protein